MPSQQYPDGFPLDAQAAIDFSYFLSRDEKQEWGAWLNSATPDQQNELVSTLHDIWIENQKQVVPAGFEEKNKQASSGSATPQSTAPKNSEKTAGQTSSASKPAANSAQTKPSSQPVPQTTSAPSTPDSNSSSRQQASAQTPNSVQNPPAKTQDSGSRTEQNSSGRPERQSSRSKNQDSTRSPRQSETENSRGNDRTDRSSQNRNGESSRKNQDTPQERRTPRSDRRNENDSNQSSSQNQSRNTARNDSGDASSDNSRSNQNSSSRSNRTNNRDARDGSSSSRRNSESQDQNDTRKNFDSRPQVSQNSSPRNPRQTQSPSQNVNDSEGDSTRKKSFTLTNARTVATQQELESLIQTYQLQQKSLASARLQYAESLQQKEAQAHRSFLDLMARSMEILSQFEGLTDYLSDMQEKLLQMNEVVKQQAKDNAATRSQVRGEVLEIKDSYDRIERDTTANYRDLKDFRTETRRRLQELSEEKIENSVDSFQDDGVKAQIDLLQAKISRLEKNLVNQNSNVPTADPSSQTHPNWDSRPLANRQPASNRDRDNSSRSTQPSKPRSDRPTNPRPSAPSNPNQSRPPRQRVTEPAQNGEEVIDLSDLV